MVIIGNFVFPPSSAKAFGECFLKVPPEPDYVKRKDSFIGARTGEGVKAMTIFEFEPSKFVEAHEYLSNRFALYFDVPGLTYSIEIWNDPLEALKMVGLE
jgi:hypothetical protein